MTFYYINIVMKGESRWYCISNRMNHLGDTIVNAIEDALDNTAITHSIIFNPPTEKELHD